MKKIIATLLLVVGFNSHANLLLIADLTIENQITISATNGTSLVDVFGDDIIGVYLADFFASNTFAVLDDSLISGNFTSATDLSDGSPNLWRENSNDSGLNIYSMTQFGTFNFNQGYIAFLGTATWIITPEAYSLMLDGPMSGNIFAPADSLDDLLNVDVALVGTWQKVKAEVSAPATFALFSLALLVLTRLRNR